MYWCYLPTVTVPFVHWNYTPSIYVKGQLKWPHHQQVIFSIQWTEIKIKTKTLSVGLNIWKSLIQSILQLFTANHPVATENRSFRHHLHCLKDHYLGHLEWNYIIYSGHTNMFQTFDLSAITTFQGEHDCIILNFEAVLPWVFTYQFISLLLFTFNYISCIAMPFRLSFANI